MNQDNKRSKILIIDDDVNMMEMLSIVLKKYNCDVSIYTETKGELLKIVPTVKVKQVKVKETVFALYAGLEVYNNLQLSNPGIKADIGIQNKKGDIFTGGYDMNQNIYIGFKKQLFNTKK